MFLNKITLQIIDFGNTPDYPTTEWIINPILPTCNSIYWKVVGNLVIEMTPSEKTLKDQQIALENRYKIKTKNQIMTELWIRMTIIVDHTEHIKTSTGFIDIVIPGDDAATIAIKQARAARWASAMLTPSFQMLSLQLDQNDYTNARARANELVQTGKITTEDYEIFDGILPLVK